MKIKVFAIFWKFRKKDQANLGQIIFSIILFIYLLSRGFKFETKSHHQTSSNKYLYLTIKYDVFHMGNINLYPLPNRTMLTPSNIISSCFLYVAVENPQNSLLRTEIKTVFSEKRYWTRARVCMCVLTENEKHAIKQMEIDEKKERKNT
jgi:hypothetical protein